MKIAIVDDEKEARRSISDLVSKCAVRLGMDPDISVFEDSESFLDAFEADPFTIVFLDIYIDQRSGLDLARMIRSVNEQTMIVFITTSRENMPEAFRFHAFDYIVKPPSAERIFSLLTDAKKVLPDIHRCMRFTANRQEIVLLFSDCIYALTNGHYLHIHAKDGSDYPARMTVKAFYDMVENDKRFLTINKGLVVNMDHIKNIEGGVCLMSDGERFPLKVRKTAALASTWQNYCFDKIRSAQTIREGAS